MIYGTQLEREFTLFLTGLKEIDVSNRSAAAKRYQAIEYLVAFNRFLTAAGVARELRAPIMRLERALDDAGHGISNEMLLPETMDLSNSRMPVEELQHKAALSVAITVLANEAKWGIKEAARLATKSTPWEPQLIIDFRKRIKRAGGSEEAKSHYDALLKIALSMPGSAEAKARKIIEDVCAELVR